MVGCLGLSPGQYIIGYILLFFVTVGVYLLRSLREKKQTISGVLKAAWKRLHAASSVRRQDPLKQAFLDIEHMDPSQTKRAPLYLDAQAMRQACARAGVESESLEPACLAALILVQCRRRGGGFCLGLQRGTEDVELGQTTFAGLVSEAGRLLREGCNAEGGAQVALAWGEAKTSHSGAQVWTAKEDAGKVIVSGPSFLEENRRLCEESAVEMCWRTCAEEPQADVWRVPIVPAASLARVADWGRAPFDFASNRDKSGQLHPLPALIAEKQQEQALQSRPAVAGDGFSTTYAELFARAAAVSQAVLQHADVERSKAVLLCMGRGESTVAAFLGVLSAGLQAVPVDVHWPQERILQVAADCDATVALADGESSLRLLQGTSLKALTVDGSLYAEASRKNLVVAEISAEETAVMLFTSGSSGKPKGIQLSHRYLSALILGIAQHKKMDQACRTLCYHSPTWMPFLDYVLTPLVVGGCVCLLPDREGHVVKPTDLYAFAQKHRVNQAGFVPAVLDILADHGMPSTLSDVGVGGAAVPQSLCERVLPLLPARADGTPPTLYTGYSGTEVGDVTALRMRSLECIADGAGASGFMAAGRPHTCQGLALLDAAFNPVGVGAVGEITVAGPGLASGYLNLPEKTAEAFLPSCAALGGVPAVRSGDLGKWSDNGSLVLVGRRDTMVKVRGARIEIGEVEGTVGAHPAVQACTVTVVEDKLVAYVSPAVPADLRDFCKAHLVAYMVPHIFEGLEELPRLPNGKVNKRLLPKPQERTDGAEAVMELDSLGRMRKFTRRAASEDRVLDNVRAILIGLVLQAHATPLVGDSPIMRIVSDKSVAVPLDASWGPVQMFILNISRSGGWSSLAFLSGFDDTRAMEPYGLTYREPLFLALWVLLGFNWTMWYLPVFVFMRAGFCLMHRLGLQRFHMLLVSQLWLTLPAFVDFYTGWSWDPAEAAATCPSGCFCLWKDHPVMQQVAHYASGWWVAFPPVRNSFVGHGLIFIPCYWIGFYGGGRIFKVLTKIADEPSVIRKVLIAAVSGIAYYLLFLVFSEVNNMLDDRCPAFWTPEGSFAWMQVGRNTVYYAYNLLTSLLWVIFIASAVPVHLKYLSKVCFASLLASGLLPCTLDTPSQALVLRDLLPGSISPGVEIAWTFFVPFMFELLVGAAITTILPIIIKAAMRCFARLKGN